MSKTFDLTLIIFFEHKNMSVWLELEILQFSVHGCDGVIGALFLLQFVSWLNFHNTHLLSVASTTCFLLKVATKVYYQTCNALNIICSNRKPLHSRYNNSILHSKD